MIENDIQTPEEDKWDKLYGDYDNQFYAGKGGKSKSKSRSTDAAHKQDVLMSQERRKLDYKEKLREVLEKLPDFNDYISWLNLSFEKGAPYIDDEDLRFEFSRSSGAGGQNVNRRETAVGCVHVPTAIKVHNEETRNQLRNRERSVERLEEVLSKHLEDWANYVHPDDQSKEMPEITENDVRAILAERSR